MEEALRLEFNAWAGVGRAESMERGHRPVGEQAIRKMNLPSDARVLDVGCGSGWASRILAQEASAGRVSGIDIADQMIVIARESSTQFDNVSFEVASAENLPFEAGAFTHAFSMESLYYYGDIPRALTEIHRVLEVGGLFVTVLDLYQENKPSHQWIEKLKVPVQLLSIADYHTLFSQAGFLEVHDERLFDPTPVPADYTAASFKSRDDYLEYRAAGSLMLTGRVEK